MVRSTAIAGVSTDPEAIVEEVFPSIALLSVGRTLNRLYECWPLQVAGVPASYWLFVPPTAPIAALLYVALKVLYPKYVITSSGVHLQSVLRRSRTGSFPLDDFAGVTIDAPSRLSFFRTGDIRLTGHSGRELLLKGVPYPERLVHVIQETAAARQGVEKSLAVIRDRGKSRPAASATPHEAS